MTANQSQYSVENRSVFGEKGESLEAHHRMPDGKLVANVQICLRCGRKFPPKRGRKNCPICQGLLRNRTLVIRYS